VEEVYEVEKIVDSSHNKKTGSTQYLVKWKGYPSTQNTWEPAENLNCPRRLEDFKKAQRAKYTSR
jgi:chromobox protein 3